MQHQDEDQPDPTDLHDLYGRARAKAAAWRAAGAADGIDRTVHPPAGSALLSTYLRAYLARPIEVPPSRGRRARILDQLFGRARLARLEDYLHLMTEEMAKTIGRLEVEVAELRSRVGQLEDRAED